MNKQLFRVVNEIKLPTYLEPASEDCPSPSVHSEVLTSMSFCWPDRSPCIQIEMYLLELTERMTVRDLDGGSLKVYASHLSHLARFCWDRRIEFHDLTTATFRLFCASYLNVPEYRKGGFKTRVNNTNISIIQTCIGFLTWFQETLLLDKVIVGPAESSPQITLKKKRVRDADGNYFFNLVFPYQPEKDTPEPKGPIPEFVRNMLWDAVAKLSKQRGATEAAENSYLTARRELILTLLESTGARPSELVEMKVSLNFDDDIKNEAILPTKKRRRADPLRKAKLPFEARIALERYIVVERKEFIEFLVACGHTPDVDALFLNASNGSRLNEQALSTEFRRIREAAGIDSRACMSMFRHRFITIQVALHLQDFLRDRPDTNRDQMIIVDKISILTRVAKITGHARPDSLLHYIDLAWDYLGVFKPVDRARDIEQLVHGSIGFLHMLERTAEKSSRLTKKEIIAKVRDELDGLASRIKSLLSEIPNKLTLPQ